MGKLSHDVRLVPPINVMSFALGLKSWLFTGSDRSGGDAAKRTGTCRKVARSVVRVWRLIGAGESVAWARHSEQNLEERYNIMMAMER